MTPTQASAGKAPMTASQHASPKSDIEIAQAAKMRPIMDIACEKLGIAPENLEPYGHYKAKVSMDFIKSLKNRPNGKLILVSAITPTPAGEGKTTTTVGLTDALNHIGKKAMLCIREPSLGPCFGVKGGAAGGGYAQVVPMEDINLHFTGDLHAIGAANNLLAALIDNHVYWGKRSGSTRVVSPGACNRYERARAAVNRVIARRSRQRLPARGRVRHHGGQRGDGDPLSRRDYADLKERLSDRPGLRPRTANPSTPATSRRREPWPRCSATRSSRTSCRRRGRARPRARRALRQHRPRLQQHRRHPARAAPRRGGVHRSRVRLRPRAPRSSSTSSAARRASGPTPLSWWRPCAPSSSTAACRRRTRASENAEALARGMENLEKHLESVKQFGLEPVVAINVRAGDTVAEQAYVLDGLKAHGVEAGLADVFGQGGARRYRTSRGHRGAGEGRDAPASLRLRPERRARGEDPQDRPRHLRGGRRGLHGDRARTSSPAR